MRFSLLALLPLLPALAVAEARRGGGSSSSSSSSDDDSSASSTDTSSTYTTSDPDLDSIIESALSSYPSCARDCVKNNYQGQSCLDGKCVCTDATFVKSFASCVFDKCDSASDEDKVLGIAKTGCSSAFSLSFDENAWNEAKNEGGALRVGRILAVAVVGAAMYVVV